MMSSIRYRVAVLALPILALIASSEKVQAGPVPNDPVVLLLKGVYQTSVKAPNLGFPDVNLNDGTWMVTEIHSVTSIPGSTNQSRAAVGHFYFQTTSSLAAYDLPGGAILMEFTNETDFAQIPDGHGGNFLQSTFELNILDATGIYAPYKGGHNHMVDRIDFLASGLLDESCFCIISEAGGSPLWWTSN